LRATPGSLSDPSSRNDSSAFGFWFVDLVLLLAIAGVVIVLATDDRDPSTVLAWLFVVLLLPILGLIAYFFIGRNFRRDSPRRRKIMAQMDAVAAESLAPVQDANTEFTEDAVADLAATPGARIEAVGHTEGGVVPFAGRHRGHLHGRLPEVPRPPRGDGDRRALHPPHVPHLGDGRTDGQGQGGPARPPQGRRSRCTSSTTGSRASVTRRTS